jgi:hypothetical protein
MSARAVTVRLLRTAQLRTLCLALRAKRPASTSARTPVPARGEVRIIAVSDEAE